MARGIEATPTSFALLGLLAIKPWTTYELAQQMDRTMSRFWPRARSKLYEEPKKLVALRLATAAEEKVGRRPRTVYSITAKGRLALGGWIARPSADPVLEFEGLVKVFFAENGTTGDLVKTLQQTRAWAHEHTLTNIEIGRRYLEGGGGFPHRAAINQLVGRFLDDFLETVDRWADWADTTVEDWPESPRDAEQDAASLAETIARAVERAARYRSAFPDR